MPLKRQPFRYREQEKKMDIIQYRWNVTTFVWFVRFYELLLLPPMLPRTTICARCSHCSSWQSSILCGHTHTHSLARTFSFSISCRSGDGVCVSLQSMRPCVIRRLHLVSFVECFCGQYIVHGYWLLAFYCNAFGHKSLAFAVTASNEIFDHHKRTLKQKPSSIWIFELINKNSANYGHGFVRIRYCQTHRTRIDSFFVHYVYIPPHSIWFSRWLFLLNWFVRISLSVCRWPPDISHRCMCPTGMCSHNSQCFSPLISNIFFSS